MQPDTPATVTEIAISRARKGRLTAWLAVCSDCGPLQTEVGRKQLALNTARKHGIEKHPMTCRLRIMTG